MKLKQSSSTAGPFIGLPFPFDVYFEVGYKYIREDNHKETVRKGKNMELYCRILLNAEVVTRHIMSHAFSFQHESFYFNCAQVWLNLVTLIFFYSILYVHLRWSLAG